MYQRLATKHGTLLYPFFLDGVAADVKLNQADGLHPNPAGVDIIVSRILPMVEELIGKAAGK
jgi:acyl-CoA thioesterase-1